jgi:hypothetical protein
MEIFGDDGNNDDAGFGGGDGDIDEMEDDERISNDTIDCIFSFLIPDVPAANSTVLLCPDSLSQIFQKQRLTTHNIEMYLFRCDTFKSIAVS